MEKTELRELQKLKGETDFDTEVEDNLKSLQIKSKTNTFALAKLFMEAFSRLNEDLPNEEKVKDIINKVNDMEKLRGLFDDYGNGREYYSRWAELKIVDFVKKQREAIQNVVNLFNKIYSKDLI
jgi:hypothetical protein